MALTPNASRMGPRNLNEESIITGGKPTAPAVAKFKKMRETRKASNLRLASVLRLSTDLINEKTRTTGDDA